MAEVKVDYGSINTVAAKLTSEGAEIANELKTLQLRVAELLTSQGGLWLQKSSPVMNAQYQEFNLSLTKAIAQLDAFGKSFNGIANSLSEMDAAMAKPSK